MSKNIFIHKRARYKLPYLSHKLFYQEYGMRWSLFYVYNLQLLKDLYLILKETGFVNLESFTQKCIRDFNLNNIHKNITDRFIYEYLHALKVVDLIKNNYTINNNNFFKDSKIGERLKNQDIQDLKFIFFDYPRFKEIIYWFFLSKQKNTNVISQKITEKQVREESSVIYSFSLNGRFTDSFIFKLDETSPIYKINDEDKDFMRFWDVFLKWGQTIGLLQRLNLKDIGYNVYEYNRDLKCIYFLKDINDDFDLLSYIKKNYKSHYIFIPNLIFNIAKSFRYPLKDINNIIISQSKKYKHEISLQRTSKKFVQDFNNLDFFLFLNNTYYSHILLL